MQKFFIDEELFEQKKIMGDVAFQIRTVLRYKPNDQFLIGVSGKTYLVKIQKITSNEVFFEVLEERSLKSELPIFVDLFQGFPKKDKMEYIIKASTQLGVHAITPVMMIRSIVKLEESKKENRRSRYQKIAIEAAEQSMREIVPEIKSIMSLKQIDFSMYDLKIVCYEEEAKMMEHTLFKEAIQKMLPAQKCAILVGPEGGITPEEIDYLKKIGFICVGLGPRILRTETAILYALSAISYEWELRK